MADSVDQDQTALFSYAILSGSFVYKILGFLQYMGLYNSHTETFWPVRLHQIRNFGALRDHCLLGQVFFLFSFSA